MRIVTIGPSPYLLTSAGKIHSWVVQKLSLEHEVAILAHTFDTSYFVPEETQNGKFFCYKTHRNVPLIPYKKGNEVTTIFDLLEKLNPDLIISVDDYESMYFMQAIQSIADRSKWLWVLVNGNSPIPEELRTVANYADAILCTNKFTFDELSEYVQIPKLEWDYVGANLEKFHKKTHSEKTLNIFYSGKNTFKDYPPAILEACQILKDTIPLKLYFTMNINDTGFYNLDNLIKRYDPEFEFVILPDKYMSINDGYYEDEMNDLLNKCQLFVSTSMTSASSISVFEAIAAGCLPLLNNQNCDKELANLLEEKTGYFDYFSYGNVPFLASNERYLYMPKVEKMVQRIIELNALLSDQKESTRILNIFEEYIKGYSKSIFIDKVSVLIDDIMKNTKVFNL